MLLEIFSDEGVQVRFVPDGFGERFAAGWVVQEEAHPAGVGPVLGVDGFEVGDDGRGGREDRANGFGDGEGEGVGDSEVAGDAATLRPSAVAVKVEWVEGLVGFEGFF